MDVLNSGNVLKEMCLDSWFREMTSFRTSEKFEISNEKTWGNTFLPCKTHLGNQSIIKLINAANSTEQRTPSKNRKFISFRFVWGQTANAGGAVQKEETQNREGGRCAVTCQDRIDHGWYWLGGL